MGIQDVRNAFIAAGSGNLSLGRCELHTVQDGNNSQRLMVDGTVNGQPFELDSGPFDPRTPPQQKAAEMARKLMEKHPVGFPQPSQAAAANR